MPTVYFPFLLNTHHLFKGREILLRLGELNFKCRHFYFVLRCGECSSFSAVTTSRESPCGSCAAGSASATARASTLLRYRGIELRNPRLQLCLRRQLTQILHPAVVLVVLQDGLGLVQFLLECLQFLGHLLSAQGFSVAVAVATASAA